MRENKGVGVTKLVVSAILVVSVVLFTVLTIIRSQPYSQSFSEVQPLSFVTESHSNSNGTLTLMGHFDRTIEDGVPILMQLRSASVTVLCGGEVLFSGAPAAAEIAGATPFSAEWTEFMADHITPEHVVAIRVFGDDAEACCRQMLGSLCTGSGDALLRQELWSNGWSIGIGALIVMTGITYIAALLALHGIRAAAPRGFAACGILLISGGLCTLIDYDYITLLLPNTLLVNMMDYLTQLAVCLSLIVYLRSFCHTRKRRRIVTAALYVMVASVPICFALQAAGVCNMTLCLAVQLPIGVVSILLTMVLLLTERRKVDYRLRMLLFSVVTLALFTAAEMLNFYFTFNYWIVLFQSGLLLFAAMQFLLLLKDAHENMLLAERTERAERELTEGRVRIMLSQIQPHFLYNVLTAIARLCDKDPKQAKQATISFSRYLRGNLDSLSQTQPVLFKTEVQHLDQYLSLEKMRFGDEMNVVYDMETTDFLLPPLSVQPLVENAIKHGIGKKENGGTVTIRTRAYADRVEIVVEDDGVGFDPSQPPSADRRHIGIDNVRRRLEAMSGGRLLVTSEPGVGTKATIILPMEE